MRLRPDTDQLQDPTRAAKAALRSVAARAHSLDVEARGLKRQLEALTTTVAPATSAVFALGPDTVGALLVATETTPTGSAQKPRSLTSAASHPSPRRRGRPTDTDCTEAVIAQVTAPCTSLSSSDSATTSKRATTPPDEPQKAYPNPKSFAARNGIWPARSSTPYSPTTPD